MFDIVQALCTVLLRIIRSGVFHGRQHPQDGVFIVQSTEEMGFTRTLLTQPVIKCMVMDLPREGWLEESRYFLFH